jgi:aconitase A
MNFLASPEIVTAIAFSGQLSFNPLTDTVMDKEGKPFKFSPPQGRDLPSAGFEKGRATYAPPPPSPAAEPSTTISVNPKSTRLELLEPFDRWDGKEFENLRVLVRVRGKCTTDHISAAGKWLAYKGHLSNISTNTLIGATNDYNGLVNVVSDNMGGKGSIPEVAAKWKSKGWEWCVVTDFNYGEGSAREHAAMQPRVR